MLPMNINYYAGLLIWLGQKTGMTPYKIYGDLSNAHLYDNSWKATEDLLEQPLRHSKVEMEYQGKEEEKGLQYPIWSSFKWNKDEVKMGKKYNVPMLTYNK